MFSSGAGMVMPMEESTSSYCYLKLLKQTNCLENCCYVGGKEIQTKSKAEDGKTLSSLYFSNIDISVGSGEILGHVNHHFSQGL